MIPYTAPEQSPHVSVTVASQGTIVKRPFSAEGAPVHRIAAQVAAGRGRSRWEVYVFSTALELEHGGLTIRTRYVAFMLGTDLSGSLLAMHAIPYPTIEAVAEGVHVLSTEEKISPEEVLFSLGCSAVTVPADPQ